MTAKETPHPCGTAAPGCAHRQRPRIGHRTNDWDRAALLLLIGFARTLERFPSATIDDLLAIFEGEEDFSAEVRS